MPVFILMIGVLILTRSPVQAQMTGYPAASISSAEITAQQQKEQEGKNLLDQIQAKTLVCQNVSDEQFDRIGEYFMGQSIGNTQVHILMNYRMKAMMGRQSES